MSIGGRMIVFDELMNSFAIRSWELRNEISITEHMNHLAGLFDKYLTKTGLVLTPRYNETYLSFRYCGLEVLRLKKSGEHRLFWEKGIEERGGKIRSTKKNGPDTRSESLENLLQSSEIESLLETIKSFCISSIQGNKTSVDREDDPIPGFSFEHWLESLFVSGDIVGKLTRRHIGLEMIDLENIVTQVPVIVKPLPDEPRRRSKHIDVFCYDPTHVACIIELKKDDDLKAADEEMRTYSAWLRGDLDEMDPEKGPPQVIQERGYLPVFDLNTEFTIRRIIVFVGKPPIHSKQNEYYPLPPNWLRNASAGRSLFHVR
jgi:hypothetical protein